MEIGQSARLYQERKGRRVTRRGPGSHLGTNDNLAHKVPLAIPLPLPELQAHLNGSPPPDAGRIPTWPHGEERIE